MALNLNHEQLVEQNCQNLKNVDVVMGNGIVDAVITLSAFVR
jgi:hypothetical protein